MRRLPQLLAIILSGCVRSSSPQVSMIEEDKSIVFPEFDAELPVVVGAKGHPYELDGVTLRALTIAANDYIPPGAQPRDCWQTQEAQQYRVIRRGDIIFVEIGVDPHSHCEKRVIPLDDGLRYAISTDGRILRRLATGEPDGSQLDPSDAGVEKSYPVSEEEMRILLRGADAPSFIPPQWRKDGGSPASLESQARGVPDGGIPDGG
ncbi:hypothetical protein [Hyalangium versicolor]|uniref:hypothetical protein n=1 Tax=Hyalangium versicolor TaxID=2861190 RepID=UPI001CCF1472|nr:hypothetical protein [Hyalangium versicolor]